MERPIRIVLADDHPVVRIGVRNMLVEKDGFEVVGEATDGDEAITQTLELQPDILLLDVQMPRLPGLEAMRAIMNGTATVKILLLTSTITTQQIIEALHIGARGIVLKDALASHLQTAIRTVSTGDYWIGGKRVVNLVSALHDLMQQAAVPQHKTYGLTPRELEVVGCIVEGCSNRDIAKQFNLSEETVKRHLSNIFDKTGVHSSGTRTFCHCPYTGSAALDGAAASLAFHLRGMNNPGVDFPCQRSTENPPHPSLAARIAPCSSQGPAADSCIQFAEGRSALSTTRASTGPLVAVILSPSCS
jgi:DNA-binding NarL/FixJ family response regulator